MGGPAPPDSSWKGGLKVPYNVGPGFAGNFSTQLRYFSNDSVQNTLKEDNYQR
jgi:hypothetical protein